MVGVELCLRRQDAVAFVMPYVRHDKFHDYFNRLDARELQAYMRNLLLALSRVHSFGIIHRDVKPSNFLHDRKNSKYLLVDFGLAQSVQQRPIAAAAEPTTRSVTVRTGQDLVAGSTRTARGGCIRAEPSAVAAAAAATLRQPPPQSSLTSSRSTPSNNLKSDVVIMKKRKAAEIEETENSSSALLSAAKRPRHVQQLQTQHQQHHHNQHQYLAHGSTTNPTTTTTTNTNSTTAMAAAAAADADNQNENPDGRANATPSSPFKTPLKQFNEISTPKNQRRSSSQR